MALIKALALENGIELASAYYKINTILYDIGVGRPSSVTIEVLTYKDQTARNANKPEVIRFLHKCTGDDFDTYFAPDVLEAEDVSIITKAYEWLKTMIQYANGTDTADAKE